MSLLNGCYETYTRIFVDTAGSNKDKTFLLQLHMLLGVVDYIAGPKMVPTSTGRRSCDRL